MRPSAPLACLACLGVAALAGAAPRLPGAAGSVRAVAAWSSPQVVGSGVSPAQVALATEPSDPQGRIYAAWNRGDAIVVSTWRAGSWGAPVPVSAAGAGASEPSVAAGPDGRVLVAWTQDGEIDAGFVGGAAQTVSSSPAEDSSSPSAAYVSGLGYLVAWRETLAETAPGDESSRALVARRLLSDGWSAPLLLYAPATTTDGGIATVTSVEPAVVDGATLAIPFTTLDTHAARTSGDLAVWQDGSWSVARRVVSGGRCGELGAGYPGGDPVVVGRDCSGSVGLLATSTGVTLTGPTADVVSPPVAATAGGAMWAVWSEAGDLLARSSSDGLDWTPAEAIARDEPVTPAAAIGTAGGGLLVAYGTGAGEIRTVHLGTTRPATILAGPRAGPLGITVSATPSVSSARR